MVGRQGVLGTGQSFAGQRHPQGYNPEGRGERMIPKEIAPKKKGFA